MINKKRIYLWVFLALLSAIPLLWFFNRPGAIINGVDTNFPLDPLVWFKRRFFVWNNVSGGGADFSSSTAGIFFHLIQVVPYVLGFSLQNVELISLVFWFSLMVGASYYLAKNIFPKSVLSQIIFVAFYCFNVYLFNIWENVKVSNLALMVCLPWFIGNIAAYKNRSISFSKYLFINLLGSIVAMGTGINPAYFITLVGGVGIYALCTRNIKSFAVFLSILFLVNSVWIFPTANFLLFSNKQISNLGDIGFTNWLDSLSQNTSLINVLRMQGAWDWYSFDSVTGAPLYLPYVVNYFYKVPFIIFSFLIPTLVFVSFLLRKKEKINLYIIFFIFFILGIFFGSGTHEPTGALYKLLVNKLPFFQFFRSPWYIFTPYLVLAYAGLLGLLIESLQSRFNKVLITGFTFMIIAGNFVYSYPLITGKIFRPSRHDGFYVKFPEYLWKTKDYLASQPNFPRLIGYPNEGLESFSWGYKGVESIISLFSDREVISSSSITQSNNLSVLAKNFYDLLEKGNYKTAKNMMPMLGINTIFNKKDTASLMPKLGNDTSEIFNVMSIGQWDFLNAPELNNLKKITTPSYIYITSSNIPETYSGVADLLEKNSLVLDAHDSVVPKIVQINPDLDAKKLSFYKAKNITYKDNPASSIQTFELEVARDSEYFIGIQDFGITQDFQITINEGEAISPSKRTDSLYVFGPVKLFAGSHKINVSFPEHKNLFTSTNYGNISRIAGLRSEDLPFDLEKTLIAFNDTNQPKSIYLPLTGFDPMLTYQFSFDYKYEYGSVPIFETLQFNENTPLRTYPVYPGSAMDWEHKTSMIEPINTPSSITIHLTMPTNLNGTRSKALVENLELKATYQSNLYVVEKATQKNIIESPEINITSTRPTEYKVESENPSENGYFIIFLDNYSSNWEIPGQKLHFTANGYANGWYIPSNLGKLDIVYKPQSLFNYGLALSLLTIGGILVLVVYYKNKNE